MLQPAANRSNCRTFRDEATGDLFRQCCRCKETLPLESFNKKSADPFGRHPSCRGCWAKYKRGWLLGDALERLGLLQKEYKKALAAQGGRCKVCRQEQQKRLVLNCDDSGRLRGLICHFCAAALKHNRRGVPNRLELLVAYLGGERAVAR